MLSCTAAMSKIIILDDSEDILNVMKYFLEQRGYQVETVVNKFELLPLIQSFTPDLIIMDIFLHGEDGREICREMRKNRTTKHLCILMFSASPKALANYEEYGADGFIEKPFGLKDITIKIEQALEKCKDYHPQ